MLGTSTFLLRESFYRSSVQPEWACRRADVLDQTSAARLTLVREPVVPNLRRVPRD
jgi:hypothetical protein